MFQNYKFNILSGKVLIKTADA